MEFPFTTCVKFAPATGFFWAISYEPLRRHAILNAKNLQVSTGHAGLKVHVMLKLPLSACVTFDPEIGFVKGMSYISLQCSAMLL